MTNTRRLISRITEDWVSKVICVAVAVLIYVFHRIAVLEHKNFTVPLKVQAEGLLVNETAVPNYVKITVRCDADSIGAVTPQGISAVLDLNQYTEPGQYDVPVVLSISQEMMLIDPLEVSVRPEYVSLVLDEQVQKYVNVQPSLSGEVNHGYVIKNIEVVPSTVKITGPSKIVEKTSHIYTERVNVKGAATGFSADVALDNVNALVRPHYEGSFRVSVSIAAAPSEQNFRAVRPSIILLDPRFKNDAEIPPLDFTLAGTVPGMENFTLTQDVVVVDCSAITEEGRYELPVLFSLPQNITVKEKSYDTVTVVVSEDVGSDSEVEDFSVKTEESGAEDSVMESDRANVEEEHSDPPFGNIFSKRKGRSSKNQVQDSQ